MQNLDRNVKIVNEDGTPTDFFMRILQERGIGQDDTATTVDTMSTRQITGSSGVVVTGSGKLVDGNVPLSADVQAILNQLAAAHGDIIFKGATDWEKLPAGLSGQFLKTRGPGADPQWATGGGGGGGSMSLIAEQVLTSPATVISFTSIPNTYKDLQIRFHTQSTYSSVPVTSINFNNDFGSNYNWQLYNSYGSAGTASDSRIRGPDAASATLTPNNCSSCVLDVLDYASTSKYKDIHGRGYNLYATNNMYFYETFGWWQNTGAINQIDFTDTQGQFNTGSRIAIYGIA